MDAERIAVIRSACADGWYNVDDRSDIAYLLGVIDQQQVEIGNLSHEVNVLRVHLDPDQPSLADLVLDLKRDVKAKQAVRDRALQTVANMTSAAIEVGGQREAVIDRLKADLDRALTAARILRDHTLANWTEDTLAALAMTSLGGMLGTTPEETADLDWLEARLREEQG